MFSNLKKVIQESSFYDAKFVFRNLNHEDLLNEAAAQKVIIDSLEETAIKKDNKFSELEEKIIKITKENERLKQSLLVYNHNNS